MSDSDRCTSDIMTESTNFDQFMKEMTDCLDLTAEHNDILPREFFREMRQVRERQARKDRAHSARADKVLPQEREVSLKIRATLKKAGVSEQKTQEAVEKSLQVLAVFP